MATYVVGDVQGCFLTFQRLLKKIEFDFNKDRMILLGDAINRGQNSLEMLRFIKNSKSIQMVLGNHEVYALALYLNAYKNDRSHTLGPLFAASDQEDLFDWLRKQPLMIKEKNHVFVHAGILPIVSIFEALEKAHELSLLLISKKAKKFLTRFYEKVETRFKPSMGRKKSLRLALSYFTFLRMCEDKDVIDLSYNGALDKAPKKLIPWFFLRDDGDVNIYFGHWAALGLYCHKSYYCLDSGCVWGNKLSAMRIEDKAIFQTENVEES